MSEVSWSPTARRDLARLDGFLRPKDPAAAEAAVDVILDSVERVARFPLSAPQLDDSGKRKLSIGGAYVAIYRPRRDGVLILRVYHASENWRSA